MKNEEMIRRAEQKDFNEVARLHRECISEGFLSTLGATFLSKLYLVINHQPGSSVFVVECDGTVCGFIAGTINTQGIYKRIFRRYWPIFIFPLLQHVVAFSKLKKIIETALYGFRGRVDSQRSTLAAELLSIAVDNKWRGMNNGRNLVNELEQFYKSHKVDSYKVVTMARDQHSNSFYKRCGFNFVTTFIHHKNVMNEYTKKI
jgi:N-acetylglutamate synthase-like GNAT family acetyltransferase